MPVNKYIFLILSLAFINFSCEKELNAEEYAQFVSDPESGLRKDVQINGFELSVMYEPADYLIGKQNISMDDSLVSNIRMYEHFQFRIRLIKGGDILLYNETVEQNEVTRINHFGFDAKNDFMLVSGIDTNYCKLAHFSRNYNLSPTVDLTLAFDKIEIKEDWQLIYEDNQFNLGRSKFLFDKNDLTDLPSLKQ